MGYKKSILECDNINKIYDGICYKNKSKKHTLKLVKEFRWVFGVEFFDISILWVI